MERNSLHFWQEVEIPFLSALLSFLFFTSFGSRCFWMIPKCWLDPWEGDLSPPQLCTRNPCVLKAPPHKSTPPQPPAPGPWSRCSPHPRQPFLEEVLSSGYLSPGVSFKTQAHTFYPFILVDEGCFCLWSSSFPIHSGPGMLLSLCLQTLPCGPAQCWEGPL